MKDLHKLEDYTIETIESFIKNELEESIHIEFKSSGALAKTEGSKTDISKDVSSFANSDGGIIIYGISEKNHKADSFSFIDGNEFDKEWLEQVITSSIQRRIPGLRIFPIRKDRDLTKTIYVVQIPYSIDAPHMYTKDKRFYKRSNFISCIMEEYEVRQCYGRKEHSILEISNYSISQGIAVGEAIEFNCTAGIQNIGKVIEKDYKLNVYLKNFPGKTSVYWTENHKNRGLSYTSLDDRFKISSSSLCPIYPDEGVDMIEFKFTIKKDDLIFAKQNSILEIMLMYRNDHQLDRDRLVIKMDEFITKTMY